MAEPKDWSLITIGLAGGDIRRCFELGSQADGQGTSF